MITVQYQYDTSVIPVQYQYSTSTLTMSTCNGSVMVYHSCKVIYSNWGSVQCKQ